MLPAFSLDGGSTWKVMYYNVSQKIPTINVVGGENEPSVKGDVNGDGTVDVADIASIISCMAGDGTIDKAAADVNEDGTVDVADIAAAIDVMAENARRVQESVLDD